MLRDRDEPRTFCARGSCKKSILLVRLVLICVILHNFGPDSAAFGPELDPSFLRGFEPLPPACKARPSIATTALVLLSYRRFQSLGNLPSPQ